ncbi:hypothetical protein [Martelella limonii]|uniref:hypothetical protein n=1 Tax=Martelella limonii TaxID=1647649 RepID=UPI00157FF472|nr:hypothetical protein [Martelella limonii]
MMNALMGPTARIALRYGAGALFGLAVGKELASDPDVVAVTSAALSVIIGVATERVYKIAKAKGWKL